MLNQCQDFNVKTTSVFQPQNNIVFRLECVCFWKLKQCQDFSVVSMLKQSFQPKNDVVLGLKSWCFNFQKQPHFNIVSTLKYEVVSMFIQHNFASWDGTCFIYFHQWLARCHGVTNISIYRRHKMYNGISNMDDCQQLQDNLNKPQMWSGKAQVPS